MHGLKLYLLQEFFLRMLGCVASQLCLETPEVINILLSSTGTEPDTKDIDKDRMSLGDTATLLIGPIVDLYQKVKVRCKIYVIVR